MKTPNIDALAESGVRFERAYLGAWCMPSRASLLTGRHPHGIESMRMEGEYPGSTYDPKQCPFWPRVFRKHGYHTAQIGKWHTGTDTGFGRDWDYQIVWNRPKHPENAGNYYDEQILAFNGEERTVDGYSTDNYTKWACEYIRGEHRPKDKPWYLWLCYGGVHGPSHPAPRHKGAVQGRQGRAAGRHLSAAAGQAEVPRRHAGLVERPRRRAGHGQERREVRRRERQEREDARRLGAAGERMRAGARRRRRRVMAALKESGQLENTLVVYTADQGFAMGEHGFRTKLAPYDANYARR